MKLIKLEILNLASLDREVKTVNEEGKTITIGEVINFEEGALKDSTIFSIVGPTGSGKSTILDAICLALYNRAPRYPKDGRKDAQKITVYGEKGEGEKNRLAPTDCRNILTHGKKDGYSKLTFIANNGSIYRAEWSVHFNQKNYDNEVTKLVKIVVENGEPKEESADWNTLPQIIGLEYEQFLRTVLIAQGSFANFLTAKEDERYELLEKLVGCKEMYDCIVREIKAKKDEAVKAYDKLSDSMDNVKQDKLNDEQLAQLEEEIKTLEDAEKKLGEMLQKVKDALQWYADDETKAKAIEEQQKNLTKAQEALDSIMDSIHRLDLHDAIAPAIDMLREIRRLGNEIQDLNGRITANQGEIKQIKENQQASQEALKQLNAQAAEAQKTIEEKTPHIKAARELLVKMDSGKCALEEKLQVKTTARKEQQEAQKALNDNEVQIKAANEAVEKTTQGVKEKEETIAKQKEVLAKAVETIAKDLEAKKKEIEGKDAEELQKNKTLADQACTDLKLAVDVLDRLNNAKTEKSGKTARFDVLFRRNEELVKNLAGIDIEALGKEVETLRKTYTLMTSENWQQHRSALEEGKPCPLCGANHHPYQQDETRFTEVESELGNLLKTMEQTLKEQTENSNAWKGEKDSNAREMNLINDRLEQLEGVILSLENQWDAMYKQHPDFPKSKDELVAMLPTFEQQQKEADAILKQYNQAQQELTRLNEQKERADKAQLDYEQTSRNQLEKAKNELSAAQTKLAEANALTPNLQKQLDEKQQAFNKADEDWKKADEILKTFGEQYRAELNGEHPDVVEERLKKAKEVSDDAVRRKTEEINQREGKLREIQGTLTSQENQVKEAKTKKEAKSAELQQWVEGYNMREDRIRMIDQAVLEAMADATDSWDAIRLEKENRNNAVVSAKTLLDNARQAHEEHQKMKPEKTREELLEEQTQLQASSQYNLLVAARVKKEKHDDAVQKLGNQADELTRLTKAKDDWTTITEAIGSDGKTLRKIAQCYTLRFLIEHANAEIRKFNSRYELQQVKNSLGIRVIDHDRADDVRDTTSLSGGETFIVSLGLALGLSSLSSRNISFENLFIDEGFGTLDPDTLTTVIDSLAMLQSSQGKKVGVISHTDTMSERITTQIRIIKNGNSGSSRIEIYPNQ